MMTYLKATKLAKPLASFACIALLLITQTAHADFRKALDAYIARDGDTMLKEVKDAVDNKNDDGLVLLLSVLELDKTLVKSRIFLSKERWNEIQKADKPLRAPIEALLSTKDQQSFFSMLETGAKQSTLESRHQFYWLAVIYGLQTKYEPYLKIEADSTFPTSTKSQLSKATSYLLKSSATKNETKGIQLLKKALSSSDAYLYWDCVGSGLSQYYFDKYKKSKNTIFLYQAYLWTIKGLIHEGSMNTSNALSVITEMHEQKMLAKAAPEMDAIATSPASNEEQKNKRDLAIIQSVKRLELPDLIQKSHKIDLKKQPVISLRRIVTDRNFGGEDISTVATNTVFNYWLDIFADGRVNFSLGTKITDGLYRTNNTETLVRLSDKEVKDLFLSIKKLGFEQTPLYTTANSTDCSKPANVGKATPVDCMQKTLEGLGYLPATYFITLRDEKSHRTVKFSGQQSNDLPQFFANTYKLVEEKIPTRQYRCGTNKGSDYYPYCVNYEKQQFEVAN